MQKVDGQQSQKILVKQGDIALEIPYSFLWVIDYMAKWYQDNNDGELCLIFKSGGITGVKEIPAEKYHNPPKNT